MEAVESGEARSTDGGGEVLEAVGGEAEEERALPHAGVPYEEKLRGREATKAHAGLFREPLRAARGGEWRLPRGAALARWTCVVPGPRASSRRMEGGACSTLKAKTSVECARGVVAP